MSRIGKIPIDLPDGVTVEKSSGKILVKGPKGELTHKTFGGINLEVVDKKVFLKRNSDSKNVKSLHGTARALVRNMIKGVDEGWVKELELVGTGYRAETSGKELTLAIGFSHPVVIKAPEKIIFKVEKNKITIEGIDKEEVGQIAARIRAVRPPEPYKGKGIKYLDEIIRRKAGKAAKAQTAA